MPSYCWPLDASVPISVVYGIKRDFGSSPNDGINPSGGHTGNDYAANIGTPVRAPGDGVIAFEGWIQGAYWQNPWWLDGKGGIVCVLDCGDTEPTFIMGHLDRTIVDKGQRVRKGQIIGYTGNTTTIPGGVGAHLHFEALPPGYILNGPTYGRVNPARYCTEYWTGTIAPQGDVKPAPSAGPVYGIDISMHQAGINVSATGAKWVCIKATEGIGYKDPALDGNLASARAAGAVVAFYHFARPTKDNDAVVEADWFVKTLHGRFRPGDGLVLDWEAENQHDTAWAKRWLDSVSSRLGTTAWVYMNTSTAKAHDWSAVKPTYPLWLADYGANTDRGFGTSRSLPSVPGWTVAAWQYSSAGRLPGYAGDLDLNIIYQSQGIDMALSKADIQLLLNTPAYDGGPTISQVLKDLHLAWLPGESGKRDAGPAYLANLQTQAAVQAVAAKAGITPDELAKAVADQLANGFVVNLNVQKKEEPK